ncbi:Probable E3 ubiquitin-protein ligase RHG1A [Linum perenne]
MQGQRGISGSLPETLDFDHGSPSGNPIRDQQLCLNNLRNPADERLSNFMLSPAHVNAYANPIDHERPNLSRWSLGEPSSSSGRSDRSRDKQKMEYGSSSSANMLADGNSRLEERCHEPTRTLSLSTADVNDQFVQSSNPNGFPHNLNLNAGLMGQGDDGCPVMGGQTLYKSSGAEHGGALPFSGPENFLLPASSRGYLMEVEARSGCSMDGRRQSCKRKAAEGQGQTSGNAGSSLFQHPEGSAWPGVPPREVRSSLSLSAAPEQVNPRLGLGVRGLGTEGIAGPMAPSSQRNFRLRINPSHQESVPSSLFSSGSAVRNNNLQSSYHSSRHIPVDHSLDFRSSPAAESAIPQVQAAANPVPVLPQNVAPFRWNESSSSRPGSSSAPINLSDREGGSSRSSARHLWEHPMFVPATELRTSARNPANRNTVGGNVTVPSNVSSASRSGSSSGVHLSAPTWVPHQSPSRNSRRLAEYVRRSLFSSAASDPGTQISNHSSAEEVVLPSGTSNQGHHRAHPRSAPWIERQGDGVLRIPYPLRTLSASSEGRSRLVSEIRNVLDLMRRGEGLRLEDVMILDQSVLFGVADFHDRHRDMRLDVDNMSYEELLALEETIGTVNTGLSEEIILNRLKQRKYCASVGMPEVETEPCCVCQEEYNNGEDIGTLDCGHDFHTGCVKQWLMLKNWCPICKTTGLAT